MCLQHKQLPHVTGNVHVTSAEAMCKMTDTSSFYNIMFIFQCQEDWAGKIPNLAIPEGFPLMDTFWAKTGQSNVTKLTRSAAAKKPNKTTTTTTV